MFHEWPEKWHPCSTAQQSHRETYSLFAKLGTTLKANSSILALGFGKPTFLSIGLQTSLTYQAALEGIKVSPASFSRDTERRGIGVDAFCRTPGVFVMFHEMNRAEFEDREI